MSDYISYKNNIKSDRTGFCSLPFVQYSTFNGGKYRLCCMAKEPGDVGKTDVNQEELGIEGTWNHDYIKDVRQKMADGEWVPECSECDHLERNEIMSSRQWENNVWGDQIEDIVAKSRENNWEVDQPLQFDFRLGNLCNLQCQMCNKDASHLVSVERRAMIDTGLGLPNNDEWRHDNLKTKKEALLQPGIDWESFEQMLPYAQKIKMIGGEPTVSPDMFKLLDIACELGYAKNIELSFYTNITNMQDRWLKQLGQFKKVIVNCSLEGMGAMNDYLRPPSKWDSVWKNFDKLVEFANTPAGKPIKVRVTTVNQVSNALHIVPFWRFMHEYQCTKNKGIGMSTNQLIEPHYYSMAMSPQWLRDEQKAQVLEFLEEIKDSEHFEDYEDPLMEMVQFGEDREHKYDERRMRQYVAVTENYDKHRGHDIMTVAPEFERIKKDL
ncbi:twitch domain-containing radical SAM protein [bacterium]|nr:twitch domain-containing radical SAM protein [bacterium]MDB4128633.1 twitch domain-containing radical SAM protein [bacterium]MDC1257263.1 twitch domain-containing radical SAM protein [bacterium]